jgi:O-glycosyl hydrolase/ankyrin repeat protein
MSAKFCESLETRRLFTDVVTGTIDGTKTYQTIDAIGAALNSGWQPKEYRDAAFLNQVTGDLGITAVRSALDPGWELLNDNNDPNTFNWTRFDDSAIGSAMEFFAQAKARGVNTFLLTVWTPSSWMKNNKSASYGGQVRPDQREEDAEYIAAAVSRAKAKWGVDITHVSIMNEPWFTEPYPSAVWLPDQWAETVKVVSAKFKKEGLATQIVGPEEVSSIYRVQKYVGAVANDPAANAAVPIIGSHYLNDNDMQTLAGVAANLNKKVWYTEIGNGQPTFDGALGLARGIDSAFTRGQASAWLNWQLSNTDQVQSLMKSGVPNPKYYALKHFARFIRPGAQRIDLQTTGAGDSVRASAYKHPTTGAFTIELSNSRTTDVALTLNLSGVTIPASFKVYRTTATQNCVQLSSVKAGSTFTVTLPAGSIETLYAGPAAVMPTLTTASASVTPKQWADAWSSTPLNKAIMKGDYDTVKSLIAGGANVNTVFGNGWTPVFIASASGANRTDLILNALLDAGANPLTRDTESATPLHVAAMSEILSNGTVKELSVIRVKRLIDAGVPVNAQDGYGRTALIYAAMFPKRGADLAAADTSVLQALLDAGADKTIKDKLGRTAYDWAVAEHASEAMALLGQPTPPPPPPPTGTASIRAYVINDLNQDGKWNNGERGIAGRTVWLDLDNDATIDADEQQLTTGDNGIFTFSNLPAGKYFIRQVLPTGWTQTSPLANAPLTITLTDGQLSSGKILGTAAV